MSLYYFFLRDLQSCVSTFDDEWQLQLIALRPLAGPRKIALVGSIQSRFSLPPAQVIKPLPLLPVLLQVLFLLQLNGALLFHHLLPMLFIVPPLHHLLGSLLLHKDVWLTAANSFMAWKSHSPQIQPPGKVLQQREGPSSQPLPQQNLVSPPSLAAHSHQIRNGL